MRKEVLTEEQVKAVLNSLRAPSFMLANIKAGGKFVQANYNLEIKMEDGKYIAIVRGE